MWLGQAGREPGRPHSPAFLTPARTSSGTSASPLRPQPATSAVSPLLWFCCGNPPAPAQSAWPPAPPARNPRCPEGPSPISSRKPPSNLQARPEAGAPMESSRHRPCLESPERWLFIYALLFGERSKGGGLRASFVSVSSRFEHLVLKSTIHGMPATG